MVVECLGGRAPCGEVRAALAREGVKVASGKPEEAIRILVGTWAKVRSDPAAGTIEAGPAASGVFADFESGVRPFHGMDGKRTNADGVLGLVALDQGGEVAESLGADAGLVAATSRYGGLPVWVVTGGTGAAVRAAAGALDADHLRDHYAVAIDHGKTVALPLEAR